MDELKPTGFETADALDRFRAVRRGQPFNILWPSDVDEAIEALEDKLNRRPAPENKPLTLEQLRQTIEYDPKGWLWLEDLTDGENSTYQRNDKTFRWSNLTNYGKTWLAYARKPEQEAASC